MKFKLKTESLQNINTFLKETTGSITYWKITPDLSSSNVKMVFEIDLRLKDVLIIISEIENSKIMFSSLKECKAPKSRLLRAHTARDMNILIEFFSHDKHFNAVIPEENIFFNFISQTINTKAKKHFRKLILNYCKAENIKATRIKMRVKESYNAFIFAK